MTLDHPWRDESKLVARWHVGELLGINQATLRNWVEDRYGMMGSTQPVGTVDRDAEVTALRREVAELRRANEILKTASRGVSLWFLSSS